MIDPEFLQELVKNEEEITKIIKLESRLKQKFINDGKEFLASLIDERIKKHKERLKRIRSIRLRVLK